MSGSLVPFVGDTWDFDLPGVSLDGVEVTGATVKVGSTTYAVVLTANCYVNRTLVSTPTPLYDSTNKVWYVRFALPRAGDLLLVWHIDVGGFVRTVRQTLKVEQGLA